MSVRTIWILQLLSYIASRSDSVQWKQIDGSPVISDMCQHHNTPTHGLARQTVGERVVKLSDTLVTSQEMCYNSGHCWHHPRTGQHSWWGSPGRLDRRSASGEGQSRVIVADLVSVFTGQISPASWANRGHPAREAAARARPIWRGDRWILGQFHYQWAILRRPQTTARRVRWHRQEYDVAESPVHLCKCHTVGFNKSLKITLEPINCCSNK